MSMTGGSLSRVVPRHTLRVRFQWCKREFMEFGVFKEARARMKTPILQDGKCYWCHRPFKDDDMMALAAPESGTNKLLCQECAAPLCDTAQAARPE